MTLRAPTRPKTLAPAGSSHRPVGSWRRARIIPPASILLRALANHDVFLSYNRRDEAAAHRIGESLRAAGSRVFLDRWELTPGQDWLPRLETALSDCGSIAVVLGPHGIGAWQSREVQVAFDRKAREPDFPVVPVMVEGADPPLGFLGLQTWIDLRDRAGEVLGLLCLQRALRGEPPGPEFEAVLRATRASVCPFRGLLAFREEDAKSFAGRAAETKTLRARVDAHPFVLVFGPSGTGKSSIVQAGLVPELRRDRAHRWDVLAFTPGARPLHALAAAIIDRVRPAMPVDERRDRVEKWGRELGAGELGLAALLEDVFLVQPGTDRVLLVVDQFEECWTLCADAAQREGTITQLLALERDPRVRVVATIRTDLLGHLQQIGALNDKLATAAVPIAAMDDDALRAVIEVPAAAVGLRLGDGLVATLLRDARAAPGRLPLLQFALEQMWRERTGDVLDLELLRRVGGLDGAIAQRADAVLRELAPAQHREAERLALRLVQTDELSVDTRRRAAVDDLGAGARQVAERFAHGDARLLVADRDELGRPTVEISHEALLTSWGWLRALVDRNREFLAWRKRIGPAVEDFVRSAGRERGSLLRGRFLVEAQAWSAARALDLSADEQRLVDASARAAKRGVLAVRGVIALLIGLLGVAVWMGWRAESALRRIEWQTLGTRMNALLDVLDHAPPGSGGEVVTFREAIRSLEEELIPSLAAIEGSLGEPNPGEGLADGMLRKSCADARARLATSGPHLAHVRARLDWLGSEAGRAWQSKWAHAWTEARAAIAASAFYGALELPRAGHLTPLGTWRDVMVNPRHTAPCPANPELKRELGIWLFAMQGTWAAEPSLPSIETMRGWANDSGSGGIVMVLILRGGGGEETIEPFYIAITELTVAQWRALGGEASATVTEESRLPNVDVSWPEAKARSESAGLRLPSDQEWESACRAGSKTEFWFGDDAPKLGEVAWFLDNSEWHAHPVGRKPSNAWGLFDVHGNVEEWCEDEDVELTKAYRSSRRVIRGGSWAAPAEGCRSAYRSRRHAGFRNAFMGFRPASSSPN